MVVSNIPGGYPPPPPPGVYLCMQEYAEKDERASVNVSQTAANDFQRGESDARVCLHVSPTGQFHEKALDAQYA